MQNDDEEDTPKQNFSPLKAEKLLLFSAKCFAEAKWAHKEVRAFSFFGLFVLIGWRWGCLRVLARLFRVACLLCVLCVWFSLQKLSDFYDEMLAQFWAEPSEGNRGPTVEELRNCEKTALKAAFKEV